MTDLRKAAEEAAKVLANALSIDFNDKRDWYSYKHDVEYAANLLRQALAQNPLDIADRAYFAGKQAGIAETLAQPEPWDTSDMAHRTGGLSMDECIDRGAWSNIPDATKWVDELRGDEESEQEHESRITSLEIRVAKLEKPMTDREKELLAGQRSLLRTASSSESEGAR